MAQILRRQRTERRQSTAITLTREQQKARKREQQAITPPRDFDPDRECDRASSVIENIPPLDSRALRGKRRKRFERARIILKAYPELLFGRYLRLATLVHNYERMLTREAQQNEPLKKTFERVKQAHKRGGQLAGGKRKGKGLTRAQIETAEQKLRAKGTRVTKSGIALALGYSEAHVRKVRNG
jgi:hypothetical protein